MKIVTDEKKIDEVLERGVEDVVVREHLKKRMMSGEKLRIKFGIDPTSPHMHLGHTVPLRKLRQFQDLGHQAVLIIGDGTAAIGDPTGRTESRKVLTAEEVDENKKTYLEQAGKILDLKTLEVRHNGEWFRPMTAQDMLQLTSLVTIQQILQREDFRKRADDPEHPLSALEILYPVMQGYDSVMVKADVELGGLDQTLNLLMGRRIQRRSNMPEQDIVTTPLLIGTDGEHKMSKSFGNAILLQDTPEDMFAKTMSVPDALIVNYFTLLTGLPSDEIAAISKSLIRDEVNPRDVKAQLATEIVMSFYGADAAKKASGAFDKLFKEHAMPEEVPTLIANGSIGILDALVAAGMVTSKADARRQVEQGGVKVDDQVVKDINTKVAVGSVIQKGKRHFVKVVKG